MRLLDQSSALLSLGQLGMPKTIQKRYEILIERPHGMILVTGPTGSGKTTTLYASLEKLNIADRKIITAEDPIEYRLKRVNQVQINSKIDLNFATVLRSALRQDPDIILLGEMRDHETVEIGLRAAMTGHMVLSTLHTNDAISSALRLIDMGVEGFLVAAALKAVLAQRLIKKVCPNCRVEQQLDSQQQAWLEHLLSQANNKTLTFPNTKPTFYTGNGCYQCNNSGYKGRIGLYELLELDEHLLQALRQSDHQAFIQLAQQQTSFVPLALAALQYAFSGSPT